MSDYRRNDPERQEQLKQLILRLHAGEDAASIKQQFRALIRDISPVEIAQMEQALIQDGLPAEEVQALCDVHVSIFQEALDEQASPETTPGHPVHTFRYENWALSELLALLDPLVATLEPGGLARLRTHADQLAEVNRIYLRKENLLFPFLEKHGVSGPSQVMWATHDDIRAQLKAFRSVVQASQAGEAAETGGASQIARIQELYTPLATAIRQMIYKEEHILYPTALKVLNEAEWLAIRDQSDDIGYCLVRPGDRWQPTTAQAAALPRAAYSAPSPTAAGEAAALQLDTGALTGEQINLLLKHLPVDVTFIDERDEVRYFSQGIHERIFVRTESVIGRRVQNCHPPKSVDIVNRLLEAFKAGERDSAAFWIQMQGRFVYIRYLAVRDEQGRYRGTLEITQDIAPLRALEGERRLLDEALSEG